MRNLHVPTRGGGASGALYRSVYRACLALSCPSSAVGCPFVVRPPFRASLAAASLNLARIIRLMRRYEDSKGKEGVIETSRGHKIT